MDLIIAIIMVGCGCCLALAAGAAVVSRGSHPATRTAQGLGVAVLALYLVFLWDQPLLATLLPFSSLIILSNWLPVLGSFFVGIYLSTGSVSVTRRRIVSGLTVCLAAYSVVAPTFGHPPECSDRPAVAGLQHQSTPFTCSAACAASLLKLHGIPASENEMADLCLTRQGTHWMGVYRGLMLKTAGTGWTVKVESFSPNDLRELKTQPAVISLNVDTSGIPNHIDHGFHDAVGHSVLSLGSPGDTLLSVFDPSPDFGLEVWGDALLQHVSSGVVLRLVPENPEIAVKIDIPRNIAAAQRERWLAAGL
ncbi:MAG: hypothetical protein R3C19_25215 [Planctomycetaceae bacterium]